LLGKFKPGVIEFAGVGRLGELIFICCLATFHWPLLREVEVVLFGGSLDAVVEVLPHHVGERGDLFVVVDTFEHRVWGLL